MADNPHETFGEVRARLDEIASEVRSKDVSLEKSLDLFEEAVRLGNRCAELIDKPDFTPEEAANAAEVLEAESEAEEESETSSQDADREADEQTEE